MSNLLATHSPSLADPALDIVPITPNDAVADLIDMAGALYVETGRTISFTTAKGNTRSVTVSDFDILPIGAQRVLATGTTAAGIHAL